MTSVKSSDRAWLYSPSTCLRSFQLYWALVVSAGLFVLQEIVLLIMAVESHGGQHVKSATLGAYIFFADLATSFWFGILLAVSAGYCITRTTLGPHKPVVIAIPVVYLITALVVDNVLNAIRGYDAFTDQPTYYDTIPEETAEKVGGTTGFVYLICLLANTMAMLLAWFFIFDTIQKEKELLEQGYPDVSAAGAGGPGAPGEGVPPFAAGGNAVLLEETGGNASHLYVDVVEADLDAPKTFQDKVDEREKLRLIRLFFYGVCGYLIATIAVVFLPLFVPTVVDRTILVLQNVVLLVFLGVLLWTFRMRQGSPYLLVDEELETGGLVDNAPTTELGVLSHGDDDEEEARPRPTLGGRPAGPASAAAARFTLSDEEEHTASMGGGSGAGGSGGGGALPPARQAALNVHAAQQGVVVEPLPTPVTPAPIAGAPQV
ncbi:hypothetical protein COHA_006754 [Chlorella ohadii]|uniref:Uncharacterized protein n=1 Tax=Chlorella ohadii TaxID=2649997 RepID=A0AAD5DKU6_9CHLO|nr:hypothetical protein COHA_006754 [Chlorella ohadii]